MGSDSIDNIDSRRIEPPVEPQPIDETENVEEQNADEQYNYPEQIRDDDLGKNVDVFA